MKQQSEKKRLYWSLMFSMCWLILAVLSTTAATYAWFSNHAAANVTPFEGEASTISEGDDGLMISLTENGEFGKECEISPQVQAQTLKPVSTADLEHFYEDVGQNRDGISLTFQEVKENPGQYMIQGSLYLKTGKNDIDVYLYQKDFSIDTDVQTLSALRLGMRITTADGERKNYLFSLDELGNTGSAESKKTTTATKSVIRSVSSGGSAEYTEDPSVQLTDFLAKENPENASLPLAGREKLCTITAKSTAKVEYWLYLEGCDDNCTNRVQAKNIDFRLAFAGVTVRKDAQSE